MEGSPHGNHQGHQLYHHQHHHHNGPSGYGAFGAMETNAECGLGNPQSPWSAGTTTKSPPIGDHLNAHGQQHSHPSSASSSACHSPNVVPPSPVVVPNAGHQVNMNGYGTTSHQHHSGYSQGFYQDQSAMHYSSSGNSTSGSGSSGGVGPTSGTFCGNGMSGGLQQHYYGNESSSTNVVGGNGEADGASDNSCYFQQQGQQQQQQVTTYGCDQEQQQQQQHGNSSICDTNSSANSTDIVASYANSGNGYYGYGYGDQQTFHHKMASGNSDTRFYHHSNNFNVNNGHHQQQQLQQPQHHNNRLQQPGSCQNQSYLTTFNRNQHQQVYSGNQQQFRRNSIESFSAEPGELQQYSTKYNSCGFTNDSQQITSGAFVNNAVTNVDGVKQESNSCASTTSWMSADMSQQNQSYFYSDGNSKASCVYSEQQTFQSNFKSCSYDSSGGNSGVTSQTTYQTSKFSNFQAPASAVKHRSLSCSVVNSNQTGGVYGFNQMTVPPATPGNYFNQGLDHTAACDETSNETSTSTACQLEPPVPAVTSIEPTFDPSSLNLNNDNFSQDDHDLDDERTVKQEPMQDENDTVVPVPSAEGSKEEPMDTTGDETPPIPPPSESPLEKLHGSEEEPQKSQGEEAEEIKPEISELPVLDASGLLPAIKSEENDDDKTCCQGNYFDDETPFTPSAEVDSNELSNGFDSLSDLLPLTKLPLGMDDNDNDSCHSDLSGMSTNHKTLSDICISEYSRQQSLSGKNGMSPQKITKRSFSEADKELVINTTAISLPIHDSSIAVPTGWKREIVEDKSDKENGVQLVLYISPSGTKLRSWEDLKNYLTSSGTCKCGLSCPLVVEECFSFDAKVTNCVEDVLSESSKRTKSQQRLLCNHKRKIPKSQDSPLISSTSRDDVADGDNDVAKKKRKTTGGEELLSEREVASSPAVKGTNVSVPISQQSPDTTTKTPSTDVSPVSVSSGDSGSTKSTNASETVTTPVPSKSPGGTRKSARTKAGKGKAAEKGGETAIAGLTTASLTSIIGSSSGSEPATNTMTFWSETAGTGNNNSGAKTKDGAKKKNTGGPIVPKGIVVTKKRGNSPCPNVDVRQLPAEQNRPPRPSSVSKPMSQIQITPISRPPSQSMGVDSNPGITLFPITSSAISIASSAGPVMNTGYSISPIMPNSSAGISIASLLPSSSVAASIASSGSTFHLPPTVSIQGPTLLNSNVSIVPLPLQFQRIASAPVMSTGLAPTISPASTFVHQSLPSSITISMIGGNSVATSGPLAQNFSPAVTAIPVSGLATADAAKKSPLQLVQDVVDRVDGDKKENEASKELSTSILPISVPSDLKVIPITVPIDNLAKAQTSAADAGKSSTEPETTGKEVKLEPPKVTVAGRPKTPSVNITICEKSKAEEDSKVVVSSATPIINAVQTSVLAASSVPGITIVPVTTNAVSTGLATTSTTTSINQPIILPTAADVQQSTFMTPSGNTINPIGGVQPIRYPFLQTVQPIFLNSTTGPGGQLIITPQGQPGDTQQFMFDQQTQQISADQQQLQPMLQSMVLDANMCGVGAGGKKKKKRLSKKQQQQQAQMQLQQQILLQQLAQQQAQQQISQSQFPFTILPQSFNFGSQGIIQPMNFFPTSTILTLPNLINLPDGSLLLQPSAPISAGTAQTQQQQVKLGQFPMVTSQSSVVVSNAHSGQPQGIAPKKDDGTGLTLLSDQVTLIKTGPASADMSDDSRQNPTPDSSTNDCQLGLNLNATNAITISLPQLSAAAPTTLIGPPLAQNNKKMNAKGRAAASSAPKRVYTQKQILPKIDSTTPAVGNMKLPK